MMFESNMICMACGFRGSINAQEVSIEDSRLDDFRYLGHDSSMGTMHYQCSQCHSCLKVDPMDILKMYSTGQPTMGCPGKDPYIILEDNNFLRLLPDIIKDGVLRITRFIRGAHISNSDTETMFKNSSRTGFNGSNALEKSEFQASRLLIQDVDLLSPLRAREVLVPNRIVGQYHDVDGLADDDTLIASAPASSSSKQLS